MPRISVIIPVYKVEEYLNRCVDSVLSQDFQDFELILVDDGSPDNSGKICDEYAKIDSRVKVIHKENGGVSSARNAGIDASIGEYITFVDSDDSIKQGFLKNAIDNMKGVDLYVSGIEMLTYLQGEVVKKDEYTIEQSGYLDIKELYERVNKTYPQICICGPYCKIFKSQIIKENNIRFDTTLSLGEDTLFNLAYNRKIKRIYFDKSIFYTYYRENNESLFSKYRENIYEIHQVVYNQWRNVINEIGVCEKAKLDYECLYLSLMIGCIHHVFKNTKDKLHRKEIISKVTSNQYIKACRTYKGRGKKRLLEYLVTHGHNRLVSILFGLRYR